MSIEAPELTREEALVEIYEKAEDNLVDFRAGLLTLGTDEVEPAEYHHDWSRRLLTSDTHEAIEGYRESAKGQYVLRAFPLHALRFPDKRNDYIIIIKQSQTLANSKLLEIEDEYLSNPALRSNLVEVKQKSSQIFSVDVRNAQGEVINVRIETYGKGSSIRGLANIDRRPKIAIIDDPQDTEDAQSDTIMENDWKWFLDDVMFLGKRTRIFLIGNNLGAKCLIERVADNREDLKFNFTRLGILVPPTQEGVEETSAWPSMFSREEIYDERESFRRMGQLDVWMRERMCQAISEENRIVTRDDLNMRYSHVYIDSFIKDCTIFTTLDPASSENKTSCYRAILTNAVRRDVHGAINWFILNIRYGRWASDKLMDELFAEVATYHPTSVGIEKGMYKQVIEPFIRQEMLRRNCLFNIVPIEHAKAGSKLERVKMLGPRFKAHGIWLPESAPWLAEFEAEMLGVTIDGFKSLYTDLIDTLAMQTQIARAPIDSGRDRNNQSGVPKINKTYSPLLGKRIQHKNQETRYS